MTTNDKWSKANPFNPSQTQKSSKTKDESSSSLSPNNILEEFEKLRTIATIKASDMTSTILSANVYEKTNNTVITELKHDSEIVKEELRIMYEQLETQFDEMKKDFNTSISIESFDEFTSFDDFYTQFKDFTLFINDSSDDIDELFETAFTYKDELHNNQLFIFLAAHLAHEHKHQHVKDDLPKKLPCGHQIQLDDTPNFCPTCGKPTKEKP